MTYKITHKNSTVSGTPPTAGDIDVGEIAINAADAELYTKDANGNIRKFQNTTTGTAAGVRFTQAGTGAVQRTVQSKLQDVVSVKDFGAVGDGVANDLAAIQAAITAAGGKTLYFPPGTYLVNLPSGGALATPAANTTIAGDSRSNTFLDIRTTSTTYLNAFGISADNVVFRDLKIGFTLQATQLATLFIFSGITSGFSLIDCELLSSNSAANLTHQSYMLNLPSASTSGVSDVTIRGCLIHNWHYTLLKTNPSQSVDRRWKIVENRFYDNETSHWSPNSPSGTHDDVLIQGNTFESLYGTGTGLVHMVGLASVTNCRIIGNAFKGLSAGEAIHAEEDSDNLVITDNVIEIGELTNQTVWGDAIRLLDNSIGGTNKNPTRVVVTGNTIKRTGSKGGAGIALQYDATGIEPVDLSIVSSNVIEGFAVGIEIGTDVFTSRVAENIIKNCTQGIYVPNNSGLTINGNTFVDCTEGVEGTGIIGQCHFINTTVGLDSFFTGRLAATGWSYSLAGVTLNPLGNTDITIGLAGIRFNGNIRFVIGQGVVSTNVLSGSVNVAYNGTIVTDTLLEKYDPGVIAYTDVLVSGGNLILRLYSAGATPLTDTRVWVQFEGMHIFT
jgi:parallel beta-helix repeat protein